MTHFIGAVVIPGRLAGDLRATPTQYPGLYGEDAVDIHPTAELQAHLDKILAKFDEALEVETWISREALIESERKRIETFRDGSYARYLSDPAAYIAQASNPHHISYITSKFPEELRLLDDDEACYAKAIRGCEADSIREDGALRDTYNPDSRWDWWTIGGRWEKTYADRQGESVESFLEVLRQTKADLAAGKELNPHRGEPLAAGGDLPWYFPYDLLTTDQTWHRIGSVGWFGTRSEDTSIPTWVDQAIAALEGEDPTDAVLYIDFHI